ncbi:hypothetical protein CP973_21205 [Streptomyces albofaciens JCM 4342]|nr:hypothetical protein CP973_21205 [Streptomyces albofaciens JCM 4342]
MRRVCRVIRLPALRDEAVVDVDAAVRAVVVADAVADAAVMADAVAVVDADVAVSGIATARESG